MKKKKFAIFGLEILFWFGALLLGFEHWLGEFVLAWRIYVLKSLIIFGGLVYVLEAKPTICLSLEENAWRLIYPLEFGLSRLILVTFGGDSFG